MSSTYTAPNVPLDRFKRTKIIATVGPATNTYAAIKDLIDAGANGLRLNFSHGTNEERGQQIEWIRKASKAAGKPVAIIQDLQGPKVRLGDFEGIVNIADGQHITLAYKADYERTGHLPIQFDLSKVVKRGERLYLFDGKIKTTIRSVKDGLVHVQAENDGILYKRRGINLPDTDFGGKILTKKDKQDIAYGSTKDFDFVALSFVQSASDVRTLRTILNNLGSSAKIIVKLETAAAVKNIVEIMQETDAAMIARGDLAYETEPESVPVVQRMIIGLGLRFAKPTIVATQMLASMTESPEATRAEVSDVATAVIVGADCVMLSEETAMGKYPVEAVETMKRVILYTQEHSPLRAVFDREATHSKQQVICESIVRMSEQLGAHAIVVETRSGATACSIASHRPSKPIITITPDLRVAQQLSILYGSQSYVRPSDKYATTKLSKWLSRNKVLKPGDVILTASGEYPGVVGSTDTIKVRVIE